MSTFAILLAGTLTVTDRLVGQLAGARAIAADGGMAHAASLDLTPELWVGDFDSTSQVLEAEWPDLSRASYPAAKAVTDGEIAVDAAIMRGATSLILVGALAGERSDHALIHILYSISLREAGHDVMLTSGMEEAWPLLPGSFTVDSPKGCLFSVVALSPIKGLTISNARYPLMDFDLAFGSSRTLSNVADGPVQISLVAGKAVVILRPYDFTGV